VYWYDPKGVFSVASRAIGTDFGGYFRTLRKTVGPPWNRDHELAMAAAIVAAEALNE
jgi:hypothetical protein